MRIRAMIVAALSACACGCGTLDNIVGEYRIEPPQKQPVRMEPEKEIYGGVTRDADDAWDSIQNRRDLGPFYSTLGVVLSAVDLPLSAVADTLTLPITVPASFERAINRHYRLGEFRDAEPERWLPDEPEGGWGSEATPR